MCLNSYFLLCAGNLYSREVQVDREQVTIQVQDTPSVEVRSVLPPPPDRFQFIFSGLTVRKTEPSGSNTRKSVQDKPMQR